MPVSLTSVNKSILPNNGGYEIRLTGVFELGTTHRVYVGSTGSTSDPICYAGQNKGNLVTPLSTTLLRCWVPQLELGGPLDVHVVQVSTSDDDTLSSVITTVKPDYKQRVFDYRRLFPPYYFMGPRNMDVLPEV